MMGQAASQAVGKAAWHGLGYGPVLCIHVKFRKCAVCCLCVRCVQLVQVASVRLQYSGQHLVGVALGSGA